jgi:pimeloyl-ACP methyl ester carboxylesterase
MMAGRSAQPVRLDLPQGAWLEGQWSFTDPRPDFAVVYLHGFCSHRYGEKAQALEAACARRGWTFASFDFRGHGTSSGTIRVLRGSGLLADLEAAWNFLAEQGARRLFLFGSSMGGWAAAWFALRYPEVVPACVLLAPGLHFPKGIWEHLGPVERESWKAQGCLRIQNAWVDAELDYGLIAEAPEFPYERLVREYRTPTLIFHGLRDDIVLPTRILSFLESAAYPGIELRLYKDGDHRLTDRKDAIAEAACDFFAGFGVRE